MWTLLAVILIALMTLGCCFLVHRQLKYFERHSFPYERPSLPHGNIHYRLHIAEVLKDLYEKFKDRAPAFGLFFVLMPSFVVTDLNVVHDILVNESESFTSRARFYDKDSDPLSAQLISLEHDEWKLLREKCTPFFSSAKIKLMFRTLLNVSDLALSRLKAENSLEMVEVREMFSKYATDVIGNVVYGIDMTALKNPNSKFCEMGRALYDYKTYSYPKILLMHFCNNLASKLRIRMYSPKIISFFLGIVEATVRFRKLNTIKRNDLLDVLLGIGDEQGGAQKLSTRDIAAQCFVFFMYGFETVSCTGAFVLYHLAMNLSVQKKLRNEVKTVLARHENKITFGAIEEMKYLEMVISETLRLFPPAYHFYRISHLDYKIPNSDLIIPRTRFVFIPIYCIHRDAEHYPEPEKFDPERFSDANKAKRHPMAFLPYGAGSNGCIGFPFGLVQIKIALIQLLLNFSILPNERTPSAVKLDPKKTSLSSESGLWLKLEKL